MEIRDWRIVVVVMREGNGLVPGAGRRVSPSLSAIDENKDSYRPRKLPRLMIK